MAPTTVLLIYLRLHKWYKRDMAYLHTNKLSLLKDKVYSSEQYLAEETRLQRELEAAQTNEKAADVDIHEAVKNVLKLSEILEDVYICYFLANGSEKAEIIQKIFSEIRFSENTYDFKYKNGFTVLKDHNLLFGDLGRNRTCIATSAKLRPIH